MPNDALSQEDIDRLMGGLQSAGAGESPAKGVLFVEEKETIREVSNIAIGAAAASLGHLLSLELDLQTPEVLEYNDYAEFHASQTTEAENDKTMALVEFTGGLAFPSLFVFKTADLALVADAILGGPAAGDPESTPEALSEIQLNTAREAINQMLGEAANALSAVIGEGIESNPLMLQAYAAADVAQFFPTLGAGPFLGVQFQLKSPENPPIDIIQLISGPDAKDLTYRLTHLGEQETEAADLATHPGTEESGFSMSGTSKKEDQFAGGGGSFYQKTTRAADGGPVTVQPVQFSAFDNQPSIYGEQHKNLDLVMDVSLNLTVELGKTEISIKEILELTRGSVVELDRIAGEPVDLLANGKLIAKGEVVVIEDNFGLRITSIVSPADRLRGLS